MGAFPTEIHKLESMWNWLTYGPNLTINISNEPFLQ